MMPIDLKLFFVRYGQFGWWKDSQKLLDFRRINFDYNVGFSGNGDFKGRSDKLVCKRFERESVEFYHILMFPEVLAILLEV